jgi:hypothetical protein
MPRKDDENEDAIPDSDTCRYLLFIPHALLCVGAAQGAATDQAEAVVRLMQLSHLS